MTDRTKTPSPSGDAASRAHGVAPEHRWHTVVATLIALALYALLPSSVTVAVRYTVVAVCVALLIPLIIYNPHHFTRESKWSRRLELGIATLLLVANLFAFAQVIVLLLQKSQNGGTLLLASAQVWITNVIAFALLYWGLDRGGPVSRTTVPRPKLPPADFRFPQDEDHDAIAEVAAGSSAKTRLGAELRRLSVLLVVELDGVQPDRHDAVVASGKNADGARILRRFRAARPRHRPCRVADRLTAGRSRIRSNPQAFYPLVHPSDPALARRDEGSSHERV